MIKKILFLTGTRADFGKLKPLMKVLEQEEGFEVYIFVTGMHMLSKYGHTGIEVKKSGFKNIYYFINQKPNDSMDTILANTVYGLGNYLHLLRPDMLVVHGDRIEALAGVISGALNNFLVAHIEGGEVSGTIDESIRHSVSKLAHVHFVANNEAKMRLIRMGEDESNIYVIGSPDIDIMLSSKLPSLGLARRRYDIDFDSYALFIYHSVTTELDKMENNIKNVVSALIKSDKNYVVSYPNNDTGSDIILREFKRLENKPNFRILPSMRFECFLTLLKNSDFIIGNSSAGVREAPVYGIPTINLGTRQRGRTKNKKIININEKVEDILNAIENVNNKKIDSVKEFGKGNSCEKFYKILGKKEIWNIYPQKMFVDIDDI